MAFLISPSEREALYYAGSRGLSSSLPERYGADFLIFTPRGRCGIQRKKFPEDFFASLDDGRLAREMAQLAYLEWRLLVPEGTPNFTTDGHLVDYNYSRWTRKGLRNLLRSARIQHGVDVEWSDSIEDTVSIVCELEDYLKENVHRSLLTRPKENRTRDEWGDHSRRDWARFFLQGFPGVGSARAEAIYDTFGRVPMRWDCTEEELMKVWGIGPKTAKTLMRLFDAEA